MKFFIATKNLKKLNELIRILEPLGIEVLSERDFDNPLTMLKKTAAPFLKTLL